MAKNDSKHDANLRKELIGLAHELHISSKQLEEMIEAEQYRAAAPKLDLSEHVKKGKVTFGVLSDTRLNSKSMRADVFKSLYHQFKQAGVSYVFHLGDITDGYFRHKGHTDQVVFHDYDQMLTKLLDPNHEIGYPDIGVKTYFIGGNMDRTYQRRVVKEVKTDVCLDIQAKRPDLVFLGYNGATVKIAQKSKVRLSHPLPGIGSKKPYAISYPLQRLITAFGGGQKPDILLVGYFERRYEFRQRDIEAHLIGSSIGQTHHEMEQNIPAPSVCGVLFDVSFNRDGSMKGVETTDIPFYT